MNQSKIEWTDYTWNPITGCSRGCEYCYARKMAQRLKGRYGYPENEPFRPTFHADRLQEPYKIKKPSKIFTCSMGELFDTEIVDDERDEILKVIIENPQHIFQILTKQARLARKYFLNNWHSIPKNLWLGSSQDGLTTNLYDISILLINNPSLTFVSFEPLLAPIENWDYPLEYIDWVIIGAQTNPYRPPKPEWVQFIIDQARFYDIPVFLKNNLNWPEKIQEYPNGRAEG